MKKNYNFLSRGSGDSLWPPGNQLAAATRLPDFAKKSTLLFAALLFMLNVTSLFAQSGETCATAIDLTTLTSPYTSTTVGAVNDYSLPCQGNQAPDLFYKIDVPHGYTLVLGQTDNDYDSTNYMGYGGACPGETQIACFDDYDFQTFTWENTTNATQTVYWVQDGYAQNSGSFTLEWSLTPPPPCNIPTAVTAQLTSATNATLSWGVPNTGTPTGYQYALTTSATPPATGTATTALSITAAVVVVNTTNYLHVRTNCGTTDGFSEWVTYSFYSGICVPAPFYTDGTGITNVTIGTINNTTVGETGNWGDYSAQVTNVGQSTTQAFSITLATQSTAYNTRVWIDWNNDLDFDDEGEQVFAGTSAATASSTLTGTFTVPANAALGNHRLRVGGVSTWNTITPCYISYNGTFEDYTVNVTVPPTCFTPNAPTAVTTAAGIATVSWTAPTLGGTPTGYEYTITTSATTPTTGTTTTATSITGVTITPNVVNYLYVRTNCGGGDFSEWVSYSFYSGVCIPSVQYTDGTGITNVTIGSINNTTVAETNGYGNYSAQVVTVGQSVTQPFSVTFNTYNAYNTKIWVDWNNDLDFDDAGEEVYSGVSAATAIATVTGSFTVPATASLGNHRLRVGGVVTWNTITPCFTGNYGTFEDYTINVTTPPSCFTPSNAAGAALVSGSANLSWTAPTLGGTPTGYEYAVTTSVTPPASGTATTNTSVTGYTGIADNVYYYLHVRTNCGGGDYSQWTTSIRFRYLPGDTCDTAIDLGTLASPYSFTTVGAGHDFTNGCSNANSAADLFYYIVVPHGYTLTLGQTDNNYDSTNYMGYGGACPGTTAIACFDDSDIQTFTWENTTGSSQTIYWVQDGYGVGEGDFTLEWTLTPPPACNIPRDVLGTMLTLTTADISWTLPNTGTPTGYEYAVTTSETPPANGTVTTALFVDGVTTTANTYNYVHVRTICGTDGYSEWVTYSFYSGHCLPSTLYENNGYNIVDVTTTNGFANIANFTSQTTGYVNNYNIMNVSQAPGGSFTYNVNVAAYTYLDVWVDWNNDLDFNDEGELVATHEDSGFQVTMYSGTITIPANTALGRYRIRFRTRVSWMEADPCATYEYGTAQDYAINVSGIPTCYTPVNLAGISTQSGSADLSWAIQPFGTTPAGFEYFVSTSPISPESGTPVTGTSVADYSPIADNTYYYLHVRSNCGGGDYSEWSVSRPFRYLAGDTCETAVDLTTLTSPYTFTTVGANNDWVNSCSVANTAPDLFYSIVVPNGYTLVIGQTDNNYDSENYLGYGGACPGTTQIACYDDPDDTTTTWENLTGSSQTLYWIQDGYGQNSGEFTLAWTLIPPVTCDRPRDLDVNLTSLTTGNLSWHVPNTGTPIGYEYAVTQSATPPASGTPVTGLTVTGVTITPNVSLWLHVRSLCGTEDGNSVWVSYPFFSGYCVPVNTGSTAYYISGITTIGGETNFSNTGTGFSAFTDYTEQYSVSTYAGGSFVVNATHPSSTYLYRVWVDWNNNFDFTDEGENEIITSYVTSPATLGSVSVPAGTPLGNYRMRIRNAQSGAPVDPCADNQYGEAEDYTVTVVATPTCFPPYAVAINPSDVTTVNLSWNPPLLGTPPAGYEYVFGPTATAPTGNGTATTERYLPEVSYNPGVSNYLWVRSTCGAGEYSSWISTAILDADAPEFNNTVMVYTEGSTITVKSGSALMTGINVFDTRGRKLYTQNDINAVQTTITDMQVQQQVLILEINTAKGKVSKRIIF